LYPHISSQSVDGAYQIVDLLPSSWVPITNLYRRGFSVDRNTYYPYEISNQQVKFLIYKRSRGNNSYLTYYARIINPGKYLAEPAVIRSTKSEVIKNYSESQKVDVYVQE